MNWVCVTSVLIIAVVLDICFVRIKHAPREKQDLTFHRIRGIWTQFKIFFPPRWVWILFSILSIAYGDYLIEKSGPFGNPLLVANSWETTYRLDIVNFNNVTESLRYLLFGCVLLVWIAFPGGWKKPAEQRLLELNQGIPDWAYMIKRLIVIGAGLTYLLIRLGEHHYETFFPLLWLILILWTSRLFWTWDKRCAVDLSLGITRSDLAWMLGLFTVALAIGTYALWDLPKIIIPDEGAFWEAARAVAKGEFLPAFFDFGVYTFPVASSIYQAWVMQLFGINMWGWRFSSVLAAAATVIPLYLLGREWFSRRTAVAACLLLVVNPYFLSFARLGYNNSQALFPVVLSVFLFVRGLRGNSYFYLWLAGIMAGLGYYVFFSAWLGLVIIFSSVLILVITKKISVRNAVKASIAIMAGGLIMVAPRLAYGVSGNQQDSFVYKIFEASFTNAFYGEAYYPVGALTHVSPLVPVGKLGNLFFEPDIYKKLLVRGVVRTLLVPLDPYIVHEHFLVTGLAGALTPVFFLVGLSFGLRGLKQTRFQIMLLWLVSGMLFLSIIEAFPPRQPQLVTLQPVIALFGAVGLTTATEALANELFKKKVPWRMAFSYGLIGMGLIVATIIGIYKYYVQMPSIYPPTFEDIASWIAWKSSRPANILYIQDSPSQSRVAYVINSKLATGSYRQEGITDFLSDNIKLSDTELQDIVAFFPVDPNGEITAHLRQILPGKVNYATFYDNDHNLLGYAITNTTTRLQLDATPSNIIDEISEMPASFLILLVVITIATLALCKSKDAWFQLVTCIWRKDKPVRFKDVILKRIHISRRKSGEDQKR